MQPLQLPVHSRQGWPPAPDRDARGPDPLEFSQVFIVEILDPAITEIFNACPQLMILLM